MKILCTGALGLIGGELSTQLVNLGHQVVMNDDLSHNCHEHSEFPQQQKLMCRVGQLSMFMDRLQSLDLIIHCASPVGHARLTPEAQVAWKIVSDTQAMLDLASRTGARLIVFSSSEVLAYRGETDIRAQYSLGKLTSEAMTLGHPGVDARVIRPYNVTGRLQRADGGFVMARFRDAVLRGEPLTVFGTGEQSRCFLHVNDFARFVCILAEWWPERQVWSVGNPRNKIMINKLVNLFVGGARGHAQFDSLRMVTDGATTLSNPHWRDTPERPFDPADYEACTALGWHPRIGLAEIVKDHLNIGAGAAKAAAHD